jgi:hypothetical protein
LTFVFVATSLGAVAGAQGKPTGGLQGVAKDTAQQNLSGVKVQVRGPNGQLAATGSTNSSGSFSFAGLNPGSYTIEILDAAGNIVGTSASVTVTAGATATVTVTAAAAGAITAAAGGGLSLFGLGTIGTVAVVGGAAAATIATVVATKDNKILICHKVPGANSQTIEVSESARDQHQAHGDTLGACPASPSR